MILEGITILRPKKYKIWDATWFLRLHKMEGCFPHLFADSRKTWVKTAIKKNPNIRKYVDI